MSEKSTTNVAMSPSSQAICASDSATRMESALASSVSGLRPSRTTLAPRRASASAAPPPMFPVAPAISVVCFCAILTASACGPDVRGMSCNRQAVVCSIPLFDGNPRGALRDGHDHVSPLVPLLDVRVGLDDLLQRIAPVDDRPDLPGLDEFLEEDKVLGTPASRT